MKAIFISYNQAYHEEILEIMSKNNIKGYTYWDMVRGRGSRGGDPHLGDHAWPTLNAAILSIVEEEKAEPFMQQLHQLDIKSEAMGLRAFAWSVETTV